MKTPEEFAEAMKGKGSSRFQRPDGPFVVSATKRSKPTNVYWPEIKNLQDAVQASNLGFGAALLIAIINAGFATFSLVQHTTILGVSALGYVDSAAFALVAWGIRCRSRIAAVFGLGLFLLEKINQLSTQPKSFMGLGLAVVLLLFFISGVRGTFAFQRLASLGRETEQAASP